MISMLDPLRDNADSLEPGDLRSAASSCRCTGRRGRSPWIARRHTEEASYERPDDLLVIAILQLQTVILLLLRRCENGLLVLPLLRSLA